MTTHSAEVVHEGEGRPIWLAHSLYETKLSGQSLSGVAVFKMTSRPNVQLAPPHVHEFDEILLVTKGLVVSFTGAEHEEHILTAGSMIFLPAGILEGFRTLHEPAEMYWFMLGDNETSEAFFALTGLPATQRTVPPEDYETPDIEVLRENGLETGFGEVVGFSGGYPRPLPN
jgi:hypothetical protein